MAKTYKQIIAIKEYQKRRINELKPSMLNKSGIYVWHRPCEVFYAGQSVHLVDRSVEHLIAYDHLGNSIRKHGLYSTQNPDGWKLDYFYCADAELNEQERITISAWCENNIPYNITSGGQDAGKYDIGTRKASKGYRDGVEQGYKKAIKEIAKLFDGKLTAEIDGKETATKQKAKEKFLTILQKTLDNGEQQE